MEQEEIKNHPSQRKRVPVFLLMCGDSFKSVKGKTISDKTIKNYVDYLIDSFLISKAVRYDIKGKKYIGSPSKYYFEDIGLRNARLNYRQIDGGHLMENIIYNA